MKRLFSISVTVVVISAISSCSNFLRYDLAIPGNFNYISIPQYSAIGEDLSGSDVFLVRQNLNLPSEANALIVAKDNVDSRGFSDKAPSYIPELSMSRIDPSSMIDKANGIITDIRGRVDPQRYLDDIKLQEKVSSLKKSASIYANQTRSTGMTTEEYDKAEFRDVYMDRLVNGEVKYIPVKFRKMVVNDKCRVYHEESLYQEYSAEYGVAHMEEKSQIMAEKFVEMYETLTKLMGDPVFEFSDGSGEFTDKKINIFVGSLTLDGTFNGVLGYFSSKDYRPFFDYGQINNGSNEGLCFYIHHTMAVSEYVSSNTMIYSTVGHEFVHMLNYGQKVVKNGEAFPTWWTETLATVGEDAIAPVIFDDPLTPGAPMADYVDYYLTKAENSEHESFCTWSGGGFAYNVHYMMGAYLARNFGGAKLINDVATNSYPGIESWDHAISKYSNDPEVTDFRSAISKYPIALITSAGYPYTTPGQYSFCKSTSDKINGVNIKFSSFDILYADSDSFPEPMRVYSLPTKEMRSFDFHVDYFGKCTATSEISISNFSPHLTYSLVYRTPAGNIISMRLATTSE